MTRDICVGIDNHQPDSIKVCCLDASELDSPWPLELRTFSDFTTFDSYWSNLEENSVRIRVATESDGYNYFGIQEWLEEQDAISQPLSVPRHLYLTRFTQFNVPGIFRPAYELALGSLHRTQFSRFSKSLLAETKQLENLLQKLTYNLELLHAVRPETGDEYCPF